MHVASLLLGLVLVVALVAWACQRFRLPTELVLVVVGVVLAAVPAVPEVRLDPDVVLTGLLPPLLWSATLRLSLFDLRRNVTPVLLLSVGAVVFTAAAVAGSVQLVLATGWAAAFAIGAVVAPPDAVAAIAVGRRVGMPRRVTALLEDESLVNDATALALLTTAIVALGGAVSPQRILGTFALSAGGGLVVGVTVGLVLGALRKANRNPTLDTTLSLAAPFVAYLPAEEIRASGVLAVVVAGVLLARSSTTLQDAGARIVEKLTWRTIGFLLENAVFLLIGLQLPDLLRRVGASPDGVGLTVVVCLVVLGTTVLARIVFLFGAGGVFRAVPRLRGRHWDRGVSSVLSWAGMRGVVTLAGAYLLPDETPHVDVLRLAAFTVVAGTLGVQGLTLPLLVRRLGLRGPDAAEDALQTATVLDGATKAGSARLEELLTGDEPDDVVDQLRRRSAIRANTAWERLGREDPDDETPSATYRRLRLAMLAAEREFVLDARRSGRWDDEVLQDALASLDFEESLLDRGDEAEQAVERAEELTPAAAANCEHLQQAPRVIRLLTPGECEGCVRDGTTWVHLRGCLSCGHVGCCDSSVGLHATKHFHDTGHPVMRSVEPNEAWRWCYVDDQVG